MSAQVDLHQHLLGEPLIAALARRHALPRVRRDGRSWVLEAAGEAPHHIDLRAEEPARRIRELDDHGVETAVVCLSSALGVESLPSDEASGLIRAHDQGLPERFARWASVPLAEPDPRDVDDALDRGAVGLALPAGALATPADIERLGALLEPLARRGRPLFVHPGPSPWEQQLPATSGATNWWTALTRYVAQMNSAWHACVDRSESLGSELRVVFALLAGCAPLQIERLASRGGPAKRALDERFYYDISSYGPLAIEAVGRSVGVRQLVYGSDRPMVAPAPPSRSYWTRLAARNSAELVRAA